MISLGFLVNAALVLFVRKRKALRNKPISTDLNA